MTEGTPRLVRGMEDPLFIAGLVDASLRPGGSISLAFSDGVVQVMLDQNGDWTITAGLSIASDRLLRLTRSLEVLGFFQATEQDGMVYHLWTSAMGHDQNNRDSVAVTLLKVVESFQAPFAPNYIS